MDNDLETIRWHVDRLMGNASPDAREELRSAFAGLDERFKRIETKLAELMKPTVQADRDRRQRDVLESALTDLAAETAQRQQGTRSSSCSWCDTMNSSQVESCQGCGHDAHRPRMQCRCSTNNCSANNTTTRLL